MPTEGSEASHLIERNMKEFKPFRLDVVNQCLWCSLEGGPDEQVSLAPRAFDVLRYLVEHPGRLITHDELLEALWPDVHVQPEVVKGHILTVRNALGDRAQDPRFIETLRGRGYRFIAPVSDGQAVSSERLLTHGQCGFVGRTNPIRDLKDCLHGALSGHAQVVFVIGEPGIGKTALLEEFVSQESLTTNIVIARGQCVEGFGGTEPYYPVLDALGRLCKGPIADDVKQCLIAQAPTWAIQLPACISPERRKHLQQDAVGARRERMLREICDFLGVLSQQHPLVVVFEDMHWADYSTVDVLSAIARRRSHARLMVIATYRPEDAGADFHPVKQLSQALLLRKLCREIALEPLTEQAVAEFLAGDGEEPVSRDFAHLVRERSGGNPLFMTATLDHLVERGLVDRTDQGWHAQTSLAEVEFDVPLTLSQVIETRIQRLTDEERRVLQAACVAGISFNAGAAAAAARMGPAAFEDVCEELCRKDSFIRRDETAVSRIGGMQTYSFRHAVYRQVFFERQGPLRRAEAHRSIGESMEALLLPDERCAIASELAQHFAAAEDWARALTYLRLALQTAKQRFAHREALDILNRAASLATHLPKATRWPVELEFLEGQASIFAAAHDPRAAEAYQQLAAAAESYGQIDTQARALLGLAYAVGWRDQVRCLQFLDQALVLSIRQTDLELQARTRVSGHIWRIWARGWSETDLRECEEALSKLEKGSDPLTAAWARIEYCMIAMISTRYREVRENLQPSYQSLFVASESRPEFNIERAVWMRHLGIPWALLFLGELGSALQEFDSGVALFEKNGNDYAATTLQLYRAWLFLHCMDFEGVLGVCARIAPVSSGDLENQKGEPDSILPAERRLCLLLAGLAESGLRNDKTALRLLSEVERCMRDQPVFFDWYWRMPLEWGLTNLSMTSGHLTEARIHADRFVQLAGKTDERTWQGLAWETSARVALEEGDHANAVKHIEKAIELTKAFSIPLADWRVHATAAAAYGASGKSRSAKHHAELSEARRTDLADSLAEGLRPRVQLQGDVKY
jgi:tetratricopeptide (TPR) repeat protein